MSGKTPKETLEWLLRDFAERVAHVQAAVVSSTDGIRMYSYGIDDTDDVDQASAISSSLFSLAKGADGLFADGVGGARQVITEGDSGLVFVTHPAAGALLTVLASHEANVGLIGYEMNMLGQSIGPALATAPRISAAG
ncbi:MULTISPECIES: roadblock/LC7 domain-containing protein [Streptomyces]|uniref:Roadblock/LC7 domain-containing protein n=1 Tax=Streptomyces akebiae TaxID=2865673 RepID=A0ABX8XJY7_9ACTN|nr:MULTISPECIES: roadblock/LC7 domain-containing protein [Streptomyces]MCX5173400.1 roadblock/LC7 domain-containing protein [Streptomyces antibioticus]MCX5173961.1 roadblock/LC7 domain-containing protein [Streptomyces antibioticus]QYX76181.1 roadblock/LC7 domain-containing protein [Streptomyces akebiae]